MVRGPGGEKGQATSPKHGDSRTINGCTEYWNSSVNDEKGAWVDPPKVYQINGKGKVSEVNTKDKKNKAAFETAYRNLSEQNRGKTTFLLRDGELVPISEKAITDLKDLSKANPLIRLGVEKLIKDNEKYKGNFPEHYYEEFAKYLVEEAAKMNGGDYGAAINEVSRINDPDKFSDTNSSALYHMYKAMNKSQDHDRVRHFIESAWLTFYFGETIAKWQGDRKEADDEEKHLKDPRKHPVGRDEKDLIANSRGRAFGKQIVIKQKEYQKQQRRKIESGSSGWIW